MIKLYWWKEEPNFGDEASNYIISRLFGQVVWKQPQITLFRELKKMVHSLVKGTSLNVPSFNGYVYPWQRAIFAIGSILDNSSYKTLIWGSGFREYNSKFQGGRVYAVRGHLSLNKIPLSHRVNTVAIGDPALLLPLVYRPNVQKSYKLSIVPHFVEYEHFNNAYSSMFNIVDVRTTDVESVINVIVASEYVLSSSLHGIIVAHAYGVPAIWIRHGWINSSDFKFNDYFSGVGIAPYHPYDDKIISELIESNRIDEFFERNSEVTLPNKCLKIIQKELINKFPISK